MDSVFVPVRFPLSISNYFDYQRLFCTVAVGDNCFERACECVRVYVSVRTQGGGAGKTHELYCRIEVPMTRFLFYTALWKYVNNKPLNRNDENYFLISFDQSLFAPVRYLIFLYGCIQAILLWSSHALHGEIGLNRRLAFWCEDQSPTVVCFYFFLLLLWGVFILQFYVSPHSTGTNVLYLIKWKMFIKSVALCFDFYIQNKPSLLGFIPICLPY